MRTKILIFLLFTGLLCQAQTKVIAFKSHSGSKSWFAKAYKKNISEMKRSNFGLPNRENILLMDTIMAVNKNMTIVKMRISKVCYYRDVKYTDLKSSDFKPICDTIYNHGFLNKKTKVVDIKKKIKTYKNFMNPVDKIVFVGFKE